MTRNDAQIARQWAEANINASTPTVPTAGVREAIARHILNTPTPRTMADMTPEEREACQWMQSDVKLANGGSATCVIANPRMPGAKVRVWAPHGGSDDVEEGRVTPLPDLPRMVWPASEPVTPDHPTFLSSVEDYDDAPVGTIVADDDDDVAVKHDTRRWYWAGKNGAFWAEDLADADVDPCTVVRWGK